MERRVIAIQGTVQGVGFRPFVYRLACGLGLTGFVRNHSGGLHIEVEGDAAALERFVAQIVANKPPLAHIHSLTWHGEGAIGEAGFSIQKSGGEPGGPIVIAPDIGTCDACLAELFDRRNRRYGYPFINCTNCGPRLTIVTGAPYDRVSTTMAGFPMCGPCRAEYENPLDRRFHAQPIACAECGPRVALRDSRGQIIDCADALGVFAAAIVGGKIGGLKGIGGYHLVCDAGNGGAVATLRGRKQRDEKPLAVMVRDLEAARLLCDMTAEEQALLIAARRPIVLLRKLAAAGGAVAGGVAPHNPALGIMLPYSPLHHLLLEAVWPAPLVMTSGNLSDEPIAYQDPDAMERLSGIADLFLTHNRPIHVACDDSVTRVIAGHESPIRRSRGYAPQPIPLPVPATIPLMALGGQQKSTFGLGFEDQAILSHHLGDLDHLAAAVGFEKAIALYEELFAVRPNCLIHDLHPDYGSTRYALGRQKKTGIRVMAVQHHHAHMASCMAEHGLHERVIGVSFDGTGLGTDGAIWGGEFLVGDYRAFTRAAHLRYVAMPGGEWAVKEPWRMAAAYLRDAGISFPLWQQRISPEALRTAERMIARGFHAPLTSSAGRFFDAAASLAGIADRVSYEGYAAMQLEWRAGKSSAEEPYPFEIGPDSETNFQISSLIIDTRPIIRGIARDGEANVEPEAIARRFHFTLVEIIAQTCARIRLTTELGAVVFSGGVFMNGLLSATAAQRLLRDGFRVYQQQLVPPNDGGIALGQLAIAAAQLTPAV